MTFTSYNEKAAAFTPQQRYIENKYRTWNLGFDETNDTVARVNENEVEGHTRSHKESQDPIWKPADSESTRARQKKVRMNTSSQEWLQNGHGRFFLM